MKISSVQNVLPFSTQEHHSFPTMPHRSENAYADYVLDVGKRISFSADDLNTLYRSVRDAVSASTTRLIDQHTAHMIGNTLLDALSRSPTFRHSVSYGIHNRKVELGEIKYRNEYELNSELDIKIEDIKSVRYSHLFECAAGQEPLIAICEAGEDSSEQPYVSFSVAPDIDSFEMPSWQEGLIHEVIHHITGAGDPSYNSHVELGPTEILARYVAKELGWAIPDFIGYADPNREAHLNERNLNALRQAAARNANSADVFFERLDRICGNSEASFDFAEYHSDTEKCPFGKSLYFPG